MHKEGPLVKHSKRRRGGGPGLSPQRQTTPKPRGGRRHTRLETNDGARWEVGFWLPCTYDCTYTDKSAMVRAKGLFTQPIRAIGTRRISRGSTLREISSSGFRPKRSPIKPNESAPPATPPPPSPQTGSHQETPFHL